MRTPPSREVSQAEGGRRAPHPLNEVAGAVGGAVGGVFKGYLLSGGKSLLGRAIQVAQMWQQPWIPCLLAWWELACLLDSCALACAWFVFATSKLGDPTHCLRASAMFYMLQQHEARSRVVFSADDVRTCVFLCHCELLCGLLVMYLNLAGLTRSAS